MTTASLTFLEAYQRKVLLDDDASVDCAGLKSLTVQQGQWLARNYQRELSFINLSPELAKLFHCVNRTWKLSPKSADTLMPFRVRSEEITMPDGEIELAWNVRLADQPNWSGWVDARQSTDWVQCMLGDTIIFDLDAIGQLQSMVIVWLLAVRNIYPRERYILSNMSSRSRNVAQQMRLSSVFICEAKKEE